MFRNIIDKIQDNRIIFASIVLSVASLVFAVYRVYRVKTPDKEVFYFLAFSGVVLLLDKIKSISFAGNKVELDAQLKEAKASLEVLEDKISYESQSVNEKGLENSGILFVKNSDDPWKGQFENEAVKRDKARELSAEVLTIQGTQKWFFVRLIVKSISPKHKPLKGEVIFFLHPTFPNHIRRVPVGKNGVAELRLKAWGAFTVGVLTDDNKTKLELDLSELENAPMEFRSR